MVPEPTSTIDTPVGERKVFCMLVLRTCDILVGIRIRGSVPLNYGSGFGFRIRVFYFIVYGGRSGWERTVFFSHTYRSQICKKVVCLLVLRTCDVLVGIRIRGSVPLNYGSGFDSGSVCFILLCMVEGRGGKEQCSFRTRTGARFAWLWRGGKEQCSVLFAHVSDFG